MVRNLQAASRPAQTAPRPLLSLCDIPPAGSLSPQVTEGWFSAANLNSAEYPLPLSCVWLSSHTLSLAARQPNAIPPALRNLPLTQHLNHPPTASELLYVCTKYFVQLSDFKILLLIFPKPHADVRLFFYLFVNICSNI